MTKTTKRYLVSTALTFVAAFCGELLFQWNGVTLEAIKSGAIVGILFAAFRAGLKVILERLVKV